MSTSTAVVPFQFQNSAIRTVTIDGEHWFVAKDVAEALGYSNSSKAISDHCKGVTKRYPLATAGGTQQARIIREPDLYRLIVGSTLPAAREFEAWIFEEVLPALRKTGKYAVPAKPLVEPCRHVRVRTENGRLVLEEYNPEIQFHELPVWLADPAVTILHPHHANERELLLDIAKVAMLRATIGAKATYELLYSKK